MRIKSFVFIILLIVIPSCFCLANYQIPKTFVILPFIDKADFEHKNWNLKTDLPSVFIDTLRKSSNFNVLDIKSVKHFLNENSIRTYQYKKKNTLQNIANTINADFVVVGTILEFSLSRVNLGNPMIGGYESYICRMDVEFFVYNALDDILTEKRRCLAEINQKELGLTLLLKPSDKYVNFEKLDELEFNSTEFKRTIFGVALEKLKKDFVRQLSKLLPEEFDTFDSDSQDKDDFEEARIVLVQNGNVYINAGSTENVRKGDVFKVFMDGEEIIDPDSGEVLGYTDKYIGKIKILKVKDKHLSLAKIIESSERIEPKNTVRIPK